MLAFVVTVHWTKRLTHNKKEVFSTDCFTAKSVWFVWFHLNHALDAILFLVIRSACDISITVGHALTLNEVAKTYLGPIIHVSLPEDKCCNVCNKDALFPHLKFFHIYSFSEVMSEAFYMPITSNYIGLSYKKLNLIQCVKSQNYGCKRTLFVKFEKVY